jgi:uracil-DNA glycosylase
MHTTWGNLPFFSSNIFNTLYRKMDETTNLCPPVGNVFRAINNPSNPEATKVLILGQDPYPTPGHANGFAFSVEASVKPLPRSLQNIFKEMVDDLGCEYPKHGNLKSWADQGVMLLNTCLTCEAFRPGSHFGWGWQDLTDQVVRHLSDETEGRVFILWGKRAQAYEHWINKDKHLVITSAHPSPLSANYGFFGSKPFSQTNAYLGKDRAIQWGTYAKGHPRSSSASPRSR